MHERDVAITEISVFNNITSTAVRTVCFYAAVDRLMPAVHIRMLTLRLLMSYIYGAPILDVSRSHTTTHHSR